VVQSGLIAVRPFGDLMLGGSPDAGLKAGSRTS
jgi:hypothetical protein